MTPVFFKGCAIRKDNGYDTKRNVQSKVVASKEDMVKIKSPWQNGPLKNPTQQKTVSASDNQLIVFAYFIYIIIMPHTILLLE